MLFRKAILIIHGFAGGTFDLEFLANRLEFEQNFDVYSFTLPGHEYGIGKVKYEEWIKSSEEHLEMLLNNGYKSIYLVGHSMGGVIATHLASKYKEIKRLVLAAPAFHYLSFKNDKIDILESLKSSKEVIKEYKLDAILARYISVPRNAIIEFISLVKKYYDTPKSLSIPILIIEGNKDKVVPISSVNYVFDNIKSSYKIFLIVKDIGHDIFTSKRKEDVTNEVLRFFKRKFVNGFVQVKREI